VAGGVSGWRKAKQASASFLKKRSKKLLDIGRRLGRREYSRDKSFLVLFFKKELLAYAY
jgi:hypothetical protein